MKYQKKKSVSKSKLSREIKAYVKKASLAKTEVKNFSAAVVNVGITHATFYALAVTQAIVQGTTNATRIGDEIFLSSLRFNWLLSSATTAGAYSYRCMVVYSGEEFNNTSTLSATSLGIGETMLPGYLSSSPYNAIVNRKAVTVLWDRVIDINSNVAAASDVTTVPGEINLKNVRFPYQATGSIYGKTKNIYFVLIPNVANGTIGTTSAGAVAVTYSVDFRDP